MKKAKEPKETASNHISREPIRLKFQRASLENLAALMPIYNSGRFMDLKQEARREMAETPADQFAIIHATREILDNKKEMQAALHALAGIAVPSGWTARFSPQAKGFLLVRRDQWNKIKNGGKSK